MRSAHIALGVAAAVFAACAFVPPPALSQTPAASRAAKAATPPAYYTGRDGTYRMPFPVLGTGVEVRDTMVNERAGWAEFRSVDGAALYVVSTRLVEGPRDARELDAVRRRYADFGKQLPEHFREWSGGGRFGPGYGFTLLNAEAVSGYPVKLGYRASSTVDAAAVHRFFVRGGVLYELAAVVPRRGDAATLPPAQLAQRAEQLVDGAVATFEPVTVKQPNAPEKR